MSIDPKPSPSPEEHELIPENDPRAIDYHESNDVTQLHAAIARENDTPIDGMEATPLWFIALCFLVIFIGGGYLMTYSGGFRSDQFDAVAFSGAGAHADAEAGEAEGGGKAGGVKELTAEQRLALGGRFFAGNCVSCHMNTGLGVAGENPPLAGSDWVLGSEEKLVRVVLHGLNGPITINGVKSSWRGNMVAWGPQLSDERIAWILSYIRQQWGNDAPEITAETVKRIREATADRSKQWTEQELAPYAKANG